MAHISRSGIREAATVIGVAALSTLAGLIAPTTGTRLDWLGYALPVAGSLVLPLRHRWPAAVVLACTASMAAYVALGYPGYGASLPLLLALNAAAFAGLRKIALLPVVVLLAGGVVRVALGAPVREVAQTTFLLAGWLVAAIAMGAAFQQWRAYVRQAEERAAEAERGRDEAARRRTVEERLRIARELHDSLTHSISVIAMQSGVAIHLARKRNEPVPEALLAIQEASRDASRELRGTLDLLRRDEPGCATLPELVARFQAVGLSVALSGTGLPVPLPADVDRAAYRIVQEALTNTSRHSGAATATVLVEHRPGLLLVRVEDDGSGRADAPPVPGIGLTGMRERVTALGGRLTAGPRDEGGFQVCAELPLAGTA